MHITIFSNFFKQQIWENTRKYKREFKNKLKIFFIKLYYVFLSNYIYAGFD